MALPVKLLIRCAAIYLVAVAIYAVIVAWGQRVTGEPEEPGGGWSEPVC